MFEKLLAEIKNQVDYQLNAYIRVAKNRIQKTVFLLGFLILFVLPFWFAGIIALVWSLFFFFGRIPQFTHAALFTGMSAIAISVILLFLGLIVIKSE